MKSKIEKFLVRLKRLPEREKIKLTAELVDIIGGNFNKILSSLVKGEENSLSDYLHKDKLDDFLNLAESTPMFRYISFIYKAIKLSKIKSKEEALYNALKNSAVFSLLEAFYQVGINDNWFNSLYEEQKEIILENIRNIKKELKSLEKDKERFKNLFNVSRFDLDNFLANATVEEIKSIIFKYLKRLDIEKFKKNMNTIEKEFRTVWKLNFYKDLSARKNLEYKELYEFIFSSQFEEAREIINLKNYYLKMIEEFEEEPIFNDPRGVALKDVYVEPYYRVYGDCLKTKKGYIPEGNDSFYVKKNKEKITELLERFLKDEKPLDETFRIGNPRVILVLGHPGEGKTSLAKKLIYDVETKIDTTKRVYLIKLRDFNKNEFIRAKNLIEYIKNFLASKENIKADFTDAVLILDGLDELLIQDKLSVEEADEFIKKLAEDIRKQVKEKENIKIIVTSRYKYINLQSVSHLFKNSLIVLELREFDLDQQVEWIENYRKFYEGLNLTKSEIKRLPKDVKELVSQPILLYMVASLFAEGKIRDLSELRRKRRSYIYSKLFDFVVERRWVVDKSAIDDGAENYYEMHKVYSKLVKLKEEEVSLEEKIAKLRQLLRELAFLNFLSDYEYVHSEDILNHERTKRLIEKVLSEELSIRNLRNLSKGLLIAFYLREVELKENNETFAIEFLHKSFYEYLTAEHIYNEVLKLKITDNETALQTIWELFSHKKLTMEIREHLRDIISDEVGKAKGEGETQYPIDNQLLQRFKELLAELVKRDFIVGRIKEGELNRPFYMFGNFWIVVKEFFGEDVLKKIGLELKSGEFFLAYLKEQNLRDKFISMLKMVQMREETKVGNLSLHLENLSETNLRGIDLQGANLRWINLRKANLQWVNLQEADLQKANLRGVKLQGAKLKRAKLQEADLQWAILELVNLQGAELAGANLKGSKFNSKEIKRAKNWKQALYDNTQKKMLELNEIVDIR